MDIFENFDEQFESQKTAKSFKIMAILMALSILIALGLSITSIVLSTTHGHENKPISSQKVTSHGTLKVKGAARFDNDNVDNQSFSITQSSSGNGFSNGTYLGFNSELNESGSVTKYVNGGGSSGLRVDGLRVDGITDFKTSVSKTIGGFIANDDERMVLGTFNDVSDYDTTVSYKDLLETSAGITIKNSNNYVGIGTINPQRRFEVVDASGNEQVRIGYSSSIYTGLKTDSSGNFSLTPTGGTTTINSNLVVSGTTQLNGATTLTNLNSNLTMCNGSANTAFDVSTGGDLTITPSGSSLTISADLTVTGTTTFSGGSYTVDDPYILLGADNAANSVDLGWHAKYVDGSTYYTGIFHDADEAGTLKFYDYLTASPTTNVVDVTNVDARFAKMWSSDLRVYNSNEALNSSANYASISVNGSGNLHIEPTGTSIAIGLNAASNSQDNYAIAIGYQAGRDSQGEDGIAIGEESGMKNQGYLATAMCYKAGSNNQGDQCIAIGPNAGREYQIYRSIAIGGYCGTSNQGPYSISMGYMAGDSKQGSNSIALGQSAGKVAQSSNAIAIGSFAALNNQGSNAIAIGNGAGYQNQSNNTIILNATGVNLNSSNPSALYVDPIRTIDTTSPLLAYDTTDKEVTYNANIVVTSSTRLGINVTDPDSTLEVNGDLHTSSNIYLGIGNGDMQYALYGSATRGRIYEATYSDGVAKTQGWCFEGGSYGNTFFRASGNGGDEGMYWQGYSAGWTTSANYNTYMFMATAGGQSGSLCIGFGHSNANATLDVLDASGPQLRLSQSLTTDYTDFTVDTNGDLNITPSGGVVEVSGAIGIDDVISGIDANAYFGAPEKGGPMSGKIVNMTWDKHYSLAWGLNFAVSNVGGAVTKFVTPNTHGSLAGAGMSIGGNGQAYSNSLAFWTTPVAATTADDDYDQSVPRMVIRDTGNIGIGDTTPTYKLDVNGDGRFVGAVDFDYSTTNFYLNDGAINIASANPMISIQDTGSTRGGSITASFNGLIGINTDVTSSSAGTTAMAWSNGRTSVGTGTSPNYLLDISSTTDPQFCISNGTEVSTIGTNNSGLYLETTGNFIQFFPNANSTYQSIQFSDETDATVLQINSTDTSGSTMIDMSVGGGNSDYDFRILRNTGANGNVSIENRGTGHIYFSTNLNNALTIRNGGGVQFSTASGNQSTLDKYYSFSSNMTASNIWSAATLSIPVSAVRTGDQVTITITAFASNATSASHIEFQGFSAREWSNFYPSGYSNKIAVPVWAQDDGTDVSATLKCDNSDRKMKLYISYSTNFAGTNGTGTSGISDDISFSYRLHSNSYP